MTCYANKNRYNYESMKTIAEKLKGVLKGDVLDDEKSLEDYSRDASIFQIKPQIVVFPKDAEDVKNLVKFVNKERKNNKNLSLTPRSAGTDMSGGPLSDSVVVSMTKYFNQIKEVGSGQNKEEGYAIVQPGTFYRDLDKATKEKGYILPSYPASRQICTVGGMVANNSGGEKNLVYGQTEQYVESLKMVLADGNEYEFKKLSSKELQKKRLDKTLFGKIHREMYKLINGNYKAIQSAKPRVSKNSSGYFLWDALNKEDGVFDLTKVIVGSQGTFGIITEIKFKLVKPKAHSKLLVIFLHDLKPLAEIVGQVLLHKPESFESYDDNTFKVGMKFFGDILKIMKGGFFTLAKEFLPEFWMVISGGVPKLVLLAEFTGDSDEEALQKAETAKKAIADLSTNRHGLLADRQGPRVKTHLAKTEREIKKYWTFRRESFNLLRHHMKGLRTAPFIDDVIVSPEKLPEFLPKLNQLLGQYDLIYTIAGHIGDGNFHIIPLMRLADPKAKNIIKNLSKEVYKLVVEFGGSITAEHNDGLVRSPFLKEMYGEKIYNLFEKTERIFDPQNIFNPVKKTGSSITYAMEHIDTKI